MEDLKKMLMDQLDLDELKSSKAIEIVLGFIKNKLPDNLQGMVDNLVNGDDDDGSNPLDAVKGLLGGD